LQRTGRGVNSEDDPVHGHADHAAQSVEEIEQGQPDAPVLSGQMLGVQDVRRDKGPARAKTDHPSAQQNQGSR
jgi:hypothetical protein